MIFATTLLPLLVAPQDLPLPVPLPPVAPSPVAEAPVPDTWFRVHPVSVGGVSALRVSAHRPQAAAATALRELARAMRWKLVIPGGEVESQLGPVVVELAFRRQPPRQIAACIAAVAGLELDFRDVGGRTEVNVRRPEPTPERLRRQATIWLERGLALDSGQVSGAVRWEALLRLGQIRLAEGAWEAAVEAFDRVYEEDDTRGFAREALLAKCRAHLALAERYREVEARRSAQLQLAEDAARRVWQLRSLKDPGEAAILVGDVFARTGQFREGVRLLASRSRDWAGTPQADAVRLRLAALHRRLGEPRHVLSVLQPCGRAKERWTPVLLRGLWFERGLAWTALWEAGDPAAADAAMDALESFLAAPEGAAPRRYEAQLCLGRIYEVTGRAVQALALTRMLLARRRSLLPEQLQSVRLLHARVRIACGDRVAALDELEIATRPDPQAYPDQVRFLVAEHRRGGNAAAAAEVASWLEGASDAPRAPRSGGPSVEADRLRRGRAQFAAGEFAEAVALLGSVEADEGAALVDVFRLARCHENLHRTADGERNAASHFERAHDLYLRIEREDFAIVAGKRQPGRWAEAARAGRQMLRWRAKNRGWGPRPLPRGVSAGPGN